MEQSTIPADCTLVAGALLRAGEVEAGSTRQKGAWLTVLVTPAVTSALPRVTRFSVGQLPRQRTGREVWKDVQWVVGYGGGPRPAILPVLCNELRQWSQNPWGQPLPEASGLPNAHLLFCVFKPHRPAQTGTGNPREVPASTQQIRTAAPRPGEALGRPCTRQGSRQPFGQRCRQGTGSRVII